MTQRTARDGRPDARHDAVQLHEPIPRATVLVRVTCCARSPSSASDRGVEVIGFQSIRGFSGSERRLRRTLPRPRRRTGS